MKEYSITYNLDLTAIELITSEPINHRTNNNYKAQSD